MKAAILREVGQALGVEEVEVSAPGPLEVRVRTVAAGLCHSDLSVMNGHIDGIPLPSVLGHESAGIVEEVGDLVSYVRPGDPVVTCPTASCGICRWCSVGRPMLCIAPIYDRPAGSPPRLSQHGERIEQFTGLGSFAEELLVHENALVRVPEDVSLDTACLLGCGVTTGLGAVFNTAQVWPGATVAVIGCGGVGLSVIQAARIAGAGRIVAVDVADSRLNFASVAGATDLVNAAEVNPVDAVQELTDGGVDFSFEVVGSKKTSEQAFKMVGRGGTVTVVGVLWKEILEIPGVDLLTKEVRLQGSNTGSSRFRVDIPRYLQMSRSGALMLDEFLTKSIPLRDINTGYDEMGRAEGLRTVIAF